MATAEQVKELRERTGAGFMDCKKALEAVSNDIDAAVKYMKEQGMIKAAKKADRITAEGRIETKISDDKKSAVIVELNCETDFVARGEDFENFSKKVAEIALKSQSKNVDELLALPYGENNFSVDEKRKELIAKLGENIQIRRLLFMQSPGIISSYKHGERIAALVQLDIANEELGKELAMHVVASNPSAVEPKDIAPEIVENERSTFVEQAKASGKPQAIVDKMIEGRMQKFLNEISLVGQPFVKDPDKTVGSLLKENKVNVLGFVRYQVGEGIEKQKSNFAEEVMAQVQGR